eukprot:490513-Prorocentrum_lima.AAC.1
MWHKWKSGCGMISLRRLIPQSAFSPGARTTPMRWLAAWCWHWSILGCVGSISTGFNRASWP